MKRNIVVSLLLVLLMLFVVSCEEPKHEHTLEKVEAVAATCSEEGMKEYYQCSVCKMTFADKEAKTEVKDLATLKTDKDPANHTELKKTEAVAATCSSEGMSEYYQCTVCKLTFADKDAKTEVKDLATLKTDKDPANHSEVNKVAAVESTCTVKGTVEHWHCEGCDKNYSDEDCENESVSIEAPLKAHTTVKIDAVAATCTEHGNKEYWHCEECGKNFSEEACENELESVKTSLHVAGDGVATGETFTVGGVAYPIYICEHGEFYLDDACTERLYKDYLDAAGLVVAEKEDVLNAVFVDGYMRLDHVGGEKVYGYESIGLYFYGKDGKQYFSRVGLTDTSGSTTFDYSANKEISFNIVKNEDGTLSISATETKNPFEEITSISINPTPNENKSDIVLMTTTGGEQWSGFRYYANPLGGSWSDLDSKVLTISDLNGDKNIQYTLDGTDYYAFPLIDSPGNNQGTLFVAWDGDGARKIFFRNRWIFLSATDLYIKWNSGALRNDLNGFTLYHPVSAE